MQFFRGIILVVFLISSVTQAQTTAAGGEFISTRRNIATIMLFGLGGAVLGLSTLSFYPRPQENLANISYGFLLGLVGGGVYVAMQPSAEEKMALDPVKELNQRGKNISSQQFFAWKFEF